MGLSRNSYYRGFDWLIEYGVLTLLIVAPFEGRGRALYQAGQAMVLAGMVGRCGMDLTWGYAARAVGLFAAVTAALLSLAFVHSFSAPQPGFFAWSASAFLSQYSLILLATAFVLCHRQSEVYERLRRHPRILAIIGAMLALWLLTAMASMVSWIPDESLRTLRKELGPYVFLFLLAIETMRTWARLRRLFVITFAVGAATCLASCLAYLLYLYASHYNLEGLKLWLSAEGETFAVRVNPGLKDVLVQAQFPFSHPNRLGSFGVIVATLGLFVMAMVEGWRLRAWIGAGSLVAVVAVFFSGTRGAEIAVLMGVAIFVLLWNWRYIFVLIAGLAIAYGAAPSIQKERIRTIFDPWTYTNLQQGNFARRVWVAMASVEMMRDHPWLGIGYGEEVFEKIYPAYKARVIANYGLTGAQIDEEDKSHAHNNILQVGASSGLPAMGAFCAFLVLLGIALLRRWARPIPDVPRFRQQAAALFALLAAMTLYGMTNYSLRGGIGMYIWLLMGATISFVQLSALPPAPLERPRK